MNARYYDSETGRFISQDSFRGDGEAFWQLYAYCDGDPVNCTDPTGHAYNRAKAYKYAMYWHNRRNTLFYTYGYDCANFVSQCLYAGGKQTDTDWHSYRYAKNACQLAYPSHVQVNNNRYNWNVTKAWCGANAQYEYFKKRRTVKKIHYKNEIKYLARQVKVGDPLYFDDDGNGEPNHAGIISAVNSKSGMICYAAHCKDRKYRSLSLYFTDSKRRVYVICMS